MNGSEELNLSPASSLSFDSQPVTDISLPQGEKFPEDSASSRKKFHGHWIRGSSRLQSEQVSADPSPADKSEWTEITPDLVSPTDNSPAQGEKFPEDSLLKLPLFRDPKILECPFNFIDCPLTFSDAMEWIQHSVTHFHSIDPPTSNSCCFCDETFHHPEGRQSWTKRMQHVALHHVVRHKLADARPDFKLYEYLWSNRLISNAVYKGLMGGNEPRRDVSEENALDRRDSNHDRSQNHRSSSSSSSSSSVKG